MKQILIYVILNKIWEKKRKSINLQNEILYSLKSFRNQAAPERARVSASPWYCEHSTGFAIDIGDSAQREPDFETEFENTDTFRWLIKMQLSFTLSYRSTKIIII